MTDRVSAPLVSIVTPVLNRVGSIRDSLASVAAQSYPNIEHIVVDGGSTDGTLEIIKEFADRPSFQWLSERDDGMYHAINRGLSLAAGEVIAYVNSDDLYLPWSVEVAVKRLQQGHSIVYGDLVVVRKETAGTPSWLSMQFYPEWNSNFFTYFMTPAQPTMFWRRDVLDAIGPFASGDYRLIADADYWLRAAEAGFTPKHTREVLAVQTEHGETLRETHGEQLRREFTKLRTDHAVHSGRPRGRLIRGLQRRLLWRWRLLTFLLGLDKGRSQAFRSFLKANGLGLSVAGVLASFLPQIVRPSISVVDAVGFYQKAVLGSDASAQ